MFWQEILRINKEQGAFEFTEQAVYAGVQWVKLGVEAVGALVITIGVVLAIIRFVAHYRAEQPSNFNSVRLTLGKYLALALEFQVGADILSTAISPTWEQIGKLGAIAAIRTVLNYFLTKELEIERKRQQALEQKNSANSESS
ncbi:MAG: hypothetical protein JWN60_1561 [Acidobacteria bacterium]|nr:hypothetical protein [Acidobacteriota bacterium]